MIYRVPPTDPQAAYLLASRYCIQLLPGLNPRFLDIFLFTFIFTMDGINSFKNLRCRK